MSEKADRLIELAGRIATTRADQERFFHPRMMPIEAALIQDKLVPLWGEFKAVVAEMDAPPVLDVATFDLVQQVAKLEKMIPELLALQKFETACKNHFAGESDGTWHEISAAWMELDGVRKQ